MARRRQSYRIPQGERPLGGENNADGLTDAFYAVGGLYRCRNYHIVGRRRLLKRQGYGSYVSTAINGANPVQGLGVRDFDGSRNLVGVCNGGIFKYDGSSAWDDISGSVTPTTGQDVVTRFVQFHDGTDGMLLGADDSSNPWYYTGSGSATALGLTQARDLAPFKRHVFAINTSLRSTAIQYTNPGVVKASANWPATNVFDCTRDSAGMALAQHNGENLLAFYERSVHRINFNYGGDGAGLSSFFTNHLVDGSRGCRSRNSVVTFKGRTYFMSDDGFYAIGDANQPAVYISRPVEAFFSSLKTSRKKLTFGFARGEPWNEVVWLVTTGSDTTHNAAMVYNPVIAQIFGDDFAWTIFDSALGYLDFNCGVNWIDSSDVHWTILGDYVGIAHNAWGTEDNATPYTDGDDDERPVETELQTGFLDLGYDGMKGLREIWFDLVLKDDRTFQLVVDRADETPQLVGSADVGAAADLLDDTFTLDESYLAGSGGLAQVAIRAVGNGRRFRLKLTESSNGIPHAMLSIIYNYVAKGMRID